MSRHTVPTPYQGFDGQLGSSCLQNLYFNQVLATDKKIAVAASFYRGMINEPRVVVRKRIEELDFNKFIYGQYKNKL